MKELISFYKWGIDPYHRNFGVYLLFSTLTVVAAFIFLLAIVIFAVSGYPLISGIMVLAPFCIAGRVAVKKYKAEREQEPSENVEETT